jgi:mRNA interferase RelE/StbE
MSSQYRLEFTDAARRQLRKLPRQAAQRLRPVIDALADDPRPAGARALQGQPGVLRVRVGDYRILYTVEDDRLVVLVIRIGHRREVYDR